MREDDGRKLDQQTLEAIRLRAVEQVARGVPAARVGAGLAALGLHRRTIYTWLAKERSEGRQALRARPVPGRARKLSDEQLRQLAAVITETDPRDHGFAVALGTREIVRQLIAARFGVQLTVASVGRTLHTLGFSAQRPLYRAEQADPAAVARWKETEYPKIAVEAKAAGGVVFFVDEAGVRSDYHAGTTWAPVGQTPTVTGTGARFGLTMISAISAQGAAVLPAGRHAHRRRVHRLPPAAGARRRRPRGWAGVRHRRPPSGAPGHGGGPLPRLHRRGAAALSAAGLLSPAQPRRVGLDQRQARRRGRRGGQRTRTDEVGRDRPAAPAAAPTAHRPRLLRRPGTGVHHRSRLKSNSEQSLW